MTRQEHIEWCKERAKMEFNYYKKESLNKGIQNGITSMMSDISKHPETNAQGLKMLCVMEMMRCTSEVAFMNFINGFN